jgi:hypothetical protein
MNLAIALFLKLAGGLWKPVHKALSWVFSDIRHAMIALLLFATAHDRWKTIPALRAEISSLTAKGKACQRTVDNVRAAARQAAIRQKGNLVRVAAAHDAINRENVSALQSDLAGLRRRAELLAGQLRESTARTDTRSTAAAGLPGSVPASAGTAEAASDQGFSGAAGTGCAGAMTITERLIASEQAHQLDKLIDAAEAAAALDLSPQTSAVP